MDKVSNVFLCSAHFTLEDYVGEGRLAPVSGQKMTLKRGLVPSSLSSATRPDVSTNQPELGPESQAERPLCKYFIP